jgi:predicted nucleotidyltransferase
MENNQILERIKQLALAVLPKGSSLWLYGSHARGDYRKNSDWDLLILLDKSKITSEDYDLTYCFRELGWILGIEISSHIYSKNQWGNWSFLPFYKNVEQDKIILV